MSIFFTTREERRTDLLQLIREPVGEKKAKSDLNETNIWVQTLGHVVHNMEEILNI